MAKVHKARKETIPNPPTIQEKRRVTLWAVELLSAAAKHQKRLATYSRMNPTLEVPANAFYFGALDSPPRAVLFGPWLYSESKAKFLKGSSPRSWSEFDQA